MNPPRGRSGIETFVVSSLKHHGARVTTLRRHAVRAAFAEPAPFSEAAEFVVAFDRKSLELYPGSLLADAASPLYMKMLALARGGGRLARAYTPIVEPLADAPPERLLEAPAGTSWRAAGEPIDHPLVVWNFVISYESMVTSDDLISIGYDAVLDRFRHPAVIEALHSLWSEMLGDAVDDRKAMECPSLTSLASRVLSELDRRIHRKVARARRNMQRHLDQEIRGVEDYYRQLIAEEREVLSRLSRTSPKEAQEREARIKRYQLDWKRRIAEEQRHHQCRVHVRLVNVAHVMVPRTRVIVEVDGKEARPAVYFNHFLGSLDGPVCRRTDNDVGPWLLDGSGQWISRWDPAASSEDGELEAPDSSEAPARVPGD